LVNLKAETSLASADHPRCAQMSCEPF